MPTPDTEDVRNIKDMVKQRRQALWGKPASGADEGLWGLALSGGGIRSATFCFGLIKALARERLLLRFDLLSTVSGGGYIGALVGKLFHQALSPADAKETEAALGDADTRWIAWWLRANGRYLLPGGFLDKVFAGTLFLRNLLAVHMELGVVGLMLGALLALLNLLLWPLVAQLPPAQSTHGLEHQLLLWFETHRGPFIQWVPTAWLLLVLPLGAAAVLACAYWSLHDRQPNRALRLSVGAMTLLSAALAWLLLLLRPGQEPPPRWAWPGDLLWSWVLAFTGLMAWVAGVLLATWLQHSLQSNPSRAPPAPASDDDMADTQQEQRTRTRNLLTTWLTRVALVALTLLLAGLVDRLGWFIAFEERQLWLGAALATLAALLRLLLPQLVTGSATRRPMVGLRLANLAHWSGVLLLLLLTAWWASVADTLVFVSKQGTAGQAPEVRALVLLIATTVYGVLTWPNVAFLNRSSLHDFYRARLTRSFLGAANGWRFEPADRVEKPDDPCKPTRLKPLRKVHDEPRGGLQVRSVHDVHAADDIPMSRYAPHRHGGPVHLINICINQTRSPRGGLFNRDRRGQLLTVAPEAQIRVGLQPWRELRGRDGAMTLGTWMSVSGAAFAPGVGGSTSMGMAALATLSGLRLGYWWDSHALDRRAQRWWSLPAVKTWMLLNELVGRFDAQQNGHWYLSDGGHYENTGVYALLAEEVALIVLADCGADPRYGFADLENLVRKARIDLQADIEFLRPSRDAMPAPAPCFGSLDDLASAESEACIALAHISYRRSGRQGALVLVKPNVCQGLPVDLINFKSEYPHFPQETTSDQFFSEAQWESYYKLGQVLGTYLAKDVLEKIPVWVATQHFVPDDCAAVHLAGTAGSAKPPVPALAPPTRRLPQRISNPTLAATVSVGALATLGIPLWQAWDSQHSSRTEQVKADEQALNEIAERYGKLETTDNTAALAALATSLLHAADRFCMDGKDDWFQRPTMAQCVLLHARELCQQSRNATIPACKLLNQPRQECLQKQERDNVSNRLLYWGQDFEPALTPCASLFPEAPASVPALAAEAKPKLALCKDNTVFIQIPGTGLRQAAETLRTDWRTKLSATVPAIEDVNAAAANARRAPPRPYPTTTVLWHDIGARPCAQALFAGSAKVKVTVQPLPAGLKPTPGTVEVWLAPGFPNGEARK